MSQPERYIKTCNYPSPSGTKPITADRYISPEILAREFDEIFAKQWLFAGLESDLQETGDYFVFNIGKESTVVSRTQTGEIAANYNVCQHRGARVMVGDMGCVDAFVCPYHGWTYAPDGRLIHVPDTDRFSKGAPADRLSLKPLRVETWAGMVFVCMDDDACSLDDFLGPVKAMINPFRPQDMTLLEDQTCHLACNWKAVFDNFQELYHVEHIHPQHALIFDCLYCNTDMMDRGHTRVVIEGFTVDTRLDIPEMPTEIMIPQMETLGMDPEEYRSRVLDVRKDVQKKRREMGPSLGHNYDLLSDDELSDIVQYNIFPNLIVVLQPENMLIMRAMPHESDPNKCHWDKFTFIMEADPAIADAVNVSFNMGQDRPVAPDNRPEHDEFDQEDIIAGRKTMTITIDQDIHFIRDVQKGMHSRGFGEAWLNDDEGRVQHYHDWYNHYLGL
ncbi:MAG: aromatic ring-hydroxylating dioxygenase subunit alpha [Proteobacteria bacterium]|nr:aromatic ring-hydroxylating dioxygenase subunit alpha [Pseudomonadota bacterium]